MNRRNERDILRWTARRAEGRASFLAADLAKYRGIHGSSEEEVANSLAISVESLPALALCKRPDPAKSNFRLEVERIASFVGADAVRLASLVREVEAVEALRRAGRDRTTGANAGFLAAARDLKETREMTPGAERGDDKSSQDQER